MSNLETRLSEKLEGEALRQAIARMRAMPRYATDWERRCAALGPDHDVIDEAILKLRSMRDPWKCPQEWLFLLAWDLSVDVWEADWNEITKRRVCAASWIVHRYKGTQFAIEEALKALGMTVALKRWFDFEPPKQRGTFEAIVYVNEQIYTAYEEFLSERHQRLAYEAIFRSKPLTRHFTFSLGVGFNNPITVGSALSCLATQKITIEAGRPNTFKTPLGIASAFAGMQVMKQTFATEG